jgi:hypothetical protein
MGGPRRRGNLDRRKRSAAAADQGLGIGWSIAGPPGQEPEDLVRRLEGRRRRASTIAVGRLWRFVTVKPSARRLLRNGQSLPIFRPFMALQK